MQRSLQPEGMLNKHLVFIYGSLRRGCSGAMSVRFPRAKFLSAAGVHGRLYDLGSFPGLQLDESSSPVRGEVYEVDDQLLKELDEFEAASNYLRERVNTYVRNDPRECWTYLPDPESYSLQKVIPSGDWVEYAREEKISGETHR